LSSLKRRQSWSGPQTLLDHRSQDVGGQVARRSGRWPRPQGRAQGLKHALVFVGGILARFGHSTQHGADVSAQLDQKSPPGGVLGDCGLRHVSGQAVAPDHSDDGQGAQVHGTGLQADSIDHHFQERAVQEAPRQGQGRPVSFALDLRVQQDILELSGRLDRPPVDLDRDRTATAAVVQRPGLRVHGHDPSQETAQNLPGVPPTDVDLHPGSLTLRGHVGLHPLAIGVHQQHPPLGSIPGLQADPGRVQGQGRVQPGRQGPKGSFAGFGFRTEEVVEEIL